MITITETLSVIDSKNNYIDFYLDSYKLQVVSKRIKNCYCIISNNDYENILIPCINSLPESTELRFVSDECTEDELIGTIREIYDNFDSEQLRIVLFNLRHIKVVTDIQTKIILKSPVEFMASKNTYLSSSDSRLYDYKNESKYIMEQRATAAYRDIITGRKLDDVYQSPLANSINKYV